MPPPPPDKSINRREFLGSSAKNAAGVAAGMVSLAGVAAAHSPASERVRVGVIGVRQQGKLLAAALAARPDVEVATLCDVDVNVVPSALTAVEQAGGRAPRFESNFRRLLDDKSLDAVVIATPDHGHALQTIEACRAGKDVYLETPASHALSEFDLLVAAAEQHRRVVQVGLQQRSGGHFQSAIEYLQSGQLGRLLQARAWTVHQRRSIHRKPETSVPEGVDYTAWLASAPVRPFQPNRFHHNWRWFWDYGSGELGNWGVHLLDLAAWGLKVDCPRRVSTAGGKLYFNDDQETPDTLSVLFDYGDCSISWEHRLWSPHAPEGRSAAVAFYGDRGTLLLDRGGWNVIGDNRRAAPPSTRLIETHLENFIACVKTRATPLAALPVARTSNTLCHLGNVAYRRGETLHLRNGLEDLAQQSPHNTPPHGELNGPG